MSRFLMLLTTCVALAAVAFVGMTIILREALMPEATAILEVHPDPWVTRGHSGHMISCYMESEFQPILGEATLALAAAQLGIDPADNRSLAELKDRLTTSPVRGTDFIQITAKDPNQRKAAEIANSIAAAYCRDRADSRKSRIERALAALDQELKDQEKLVDDLHQQLRARSAENGAPGFEAASDQLARHSEQEDGYRDAKTAYDQSKEMLREMTHVANEAHAHLKTRHQPVTLWKKAR